MLASASYALAQDKTLTIESWRNDDLAVWQDKIIPAFEAKNPGIKVTFSPMAPTEYNSAVNAKLDAGTAGDLITCRPFDLSLAMFSRASSRLSTTCPASRTSRTWRSRHGRPTTARPRFCVPMASVIHGFIYNKDAFDKLGIAIPATEDEFFAALDKIKADGTYIPLAMGTKDQWEAATMGYYNIGPNYYKGEEGRKALIKATQKLTDPAWVEPYATLAKWKPYLGDGFEAQTYPDSQNLFTLGRAAIYPAGSWEITGFNTQAQFKMGAFPPPVKAAGDTCYISDHNDIGLRSTQRARTQDAARTFLSWVASPEFADIYANSLPGFFSMNSTPVKMNDPLAQEFVSWREKCKSTIRL